MHYAHHVRHIKRVIAALLTLAVILFAPRAFATSCAAPELKGSSDRADVILVGVVAAETPMGGGMGIYRLRVDRVFKGSVPATVNVSGGGMKGSSFTVGERYLVFGKLPEPSAPRPPDLFAHLCGGTQPAARAADWLAALGAGTSPTAAGTAITAGSTADVPAAPQFASAPPAQTEVPPPRPLADSTAPSPPTDSSQATTGSTPATSGGCAGCTSAGRHRPAPSFAAALMALLCVARRFGGSVRDRASR